MRSEKRITIAGNKAVLRDLANGILKYLAEEDPKKQGDFRLAIGDIDLEVVIALFNDGSAVGSGRNTAHSQFSIKISETCSSGY